MLTDLFMQYLTSPAAFTPSIIKFSVAKNGKYSATAGP